MSCSYGIVVIACIYLLNITDVSGVITNTPLNTVAEVGQQAIFNCTSSITQQNWVLATKREDVGTAAAENIAISCVVQPGFTTHYEVDRPGGNNNICNLIVKDVTMQQAGIYTCTDTGTGPSAILTVLDSSSPKITYNNTPDVMEGESVVITCSSNYNGSVEPAPTLRPYFYCTDYTGNNVSNVYNPPPTNNSVLSQLTVTAGREDIMPYICRVYMQLMPSVTAGYATNTPSVDSSATSPTIPVLYAPSPPVTKSRPEVITINGIPCGITVLRCSNSTGNPTTHYRWYDTADSVILATSNELTLAEVGRNYRCEAYNTIRKVEHNALANYTVSDANCGPTSAVQCCVFPRKETTSVTVKGCDNGTLCDCSQANSGIILTCNVKTFPNASYMWKGPSGQDLVTNSPIYDKVTMNGIYRCTAYFNKASSNYTGDVIFPNCTNETTVDKCYTNSPDTADPIRTILLACVLGGYGLLNLFATIAFIVYYNRKSNNVTFKNKMALNARFPWLQRMLPCMNESEGNAGCSFLWVLLFILMSIFAGIIVFPILVAMANCSGERNDAKDDTDIGTSNVYQKDSVDLYASVKSSTDAHGLVNVEALYDDVGPMQPGRTVVLEEPTSSDTKADEKVLYTKVNLNFNAEEGVQRYPVSQPI